jgi:hypothetical protein
MPYKLKEIGGEYEVMNVQSRKTHGKTSKKNAKAQMRLLQAIEHGYIPKRK